MKLLSWAGGLIAGTLLVATMFVSRPEFNSHVNWGEKREDQIVTELASIRADIKQILWRVGGTSAKLESEDINQRIEKAWQRALKLGKVKKDVAPKIPRPEVSVYPTANYLAPDVNGRLCGWTWRLWEKNDTGEWKPVVRVSVWVRPEEVALLDDALTHEFLHVVLGGPGWLADENAVVSMLPTTCPAN